MSILFIVRLCACLHVCVCCVHCLAFYSAHATSLELSVSLTIYACSDATGLSPQILYLVTASDAAAVVVQQYESHTLGVLCSNVSTSAYLFGGFNSTDGQYTPTVISVDGNGVQSRVLSAAVRQTPRKDAAGGCGSKSCTFVGGWCAIWRLLRCLIVLLRSRSKFPDAGTKREPWTLWTCCGRLHCSLASSLATRS